MCEPTEKLIENFLSLAKDLAKTGSVPPVAWVGHHENPSGFITIPLEIKNGEIDKDAAADLKEAAWDLHADFVVWVTESYAIHDREALEDYTKNRSKYPSVADHPARKEVLLVKCETPGANLLGIVPIFKSGKGRVTLGKIQYFSHEVPTETETKFLRPSH